MKKGRRRLSSHVLKQMRSDYRRVMLLLTAVFIVCLLLGSAVIYFISSIQYGREYSTSAKALLQEFADGTGVRSGSNLSTVFFDADGKILLYYDAEDNAPDYAKILRSFPIEEGADTRFKLLLQSEPIRFYGVVATSFRLLTGNSKTIYIYYIWNLPAVTSAYAAFYIAYAVVFLLGISMLYLYYIKLAEIETMRRDYVSNVSHELKTPIASIKALTEALADGMVTDEAAVSRYYGIMLSEAGRLEKAVLNLLELNRLQSGSIKLQKTVIPANSIFTPISEKFTVRCDDLGIEFKSEVADSGIPNLYTNAGAITELTEILLDNAVKFTGDGGHISITVRRSPREAVLCVRDDGCGIKQKDIINVFDRFYKGDSGQTGSGLGLAIAKEITKQLGERLWVESREGEGAAFYFTVSLSPTSGII